MALATYCEHKFHPYTGMCEKCHACVANVLDTEGATAVQWSDDCAKWFGGGEPGALAYHTDPSNSAKPTQEARLDSLEKMVIQLQQAVIDLQYEKGIRQIAEDEARLLPENDRHVLSRNARIAQAIVDVSAGR